MRTHPVPDPRGRRDQSHDPRYLNRVSPLQVPAGQGGRRFALAEGAERLVEFHNNPADELPLLCRTQAPSSPLSTRAERPRPAAPHAVFPQSPRVVSAVRRTGPSTPLSSRAESPRPAAPHAVFPMSRPTGTSKRFVAQTRALPSRAGRRALSTCGTPRRVPVESPHRY